MITSNVGAGTTELHVLRSRPGVDNRWVRYALLSRHFLAEGVTAFEGVAGLQRVPSEFLQEFEVADVDFMEQRRIADFLDDRVARIDQIINARAGQIKLLDAAAISASFDAIRGTASLRRDSGLAWLGSVPEDWPILTVNTEFQVELGKMLDEKQQTGDATIPYLRNTNVQWDRVDTTDLKYMDVPVEQRTRFTVKPGDLLICEGGQPGRAAIYAGDIELIGFQKALHRARSRGRSQPAWLLECLRVAVHLGVFAVENGQTTIGHLTNEQLRSTRFPFPPAELQNAILGALAQNREASSSLKNAVRASTDLLQEYKQSLITAAVTGELDVTTAGSGIPG